VWFRWGTTCFNVGSQSTFLLFVIFTRIRVVIVKCPIFRTIWCRKLVPEWEQLGCRWQILIFHCVFGFGGWSLLCCLNKSNNWMSGLPIPSKPWERGTAFGQNHLPIVWEGPHTLHDKYEGPSICFGHTLYTHKKVHDIH